MIRTRDGASAPERQLLKRYRSLPSQEQSTLLAFAEFLAARAREPTAQVQAPLIPEPIARPSQESVVAAIKRLSRTYYMLDRSTMLSDTSALMGAHVLQGRAAGEVIDELEALFTRHYASYREQQERQGA